MNIHQTPPFRVWAAIQAALSPAIAPVVNPLVRRYELRRAQQLGELAALAERSMPEQAAGLRSIAAEHARRAAAL